MLWASEGMLVQISENTQNFDVSRIFFSEETYIFFQVTCTLRLFFFPFGSVVIFELWVVAVLAPNSSDGRHWPLASFLITEFLGSLGNPHRTTR
jgi:hypothetical protein